jgi:hypothetical protein
MSEALPVALYQPMEQGDGDKDNFQQLCRGKWNG